jgi:hypothetical protein
MHTAGSVLLDTNVVIAHFRNDPDLTTRLRLFIFYGWSWVNSTMARPTRTAAGGTTGANSRVSANRDSSAAGPKYH